MTTLIGQELVRERLYRELLQTFERSQLRVKAKNLRNMLLRYRFNLRPTAEDDPVFVLTRTEGAETQFLRDCTYFRLNGKPVEILTWLQSRIQAALITLRETVLETDPPVLLRKGHLVFGSREFPDLRELGKVDSVRAFALHLRYGYLQLNNHGLARLYDGDRSKGVEAFASAFNHYHDHYCSAFPDLEAVFGSLGSFFSQASLEQSTVYVNPPFDETVMAQAFEQIYHWLANGASNTFIITAPQWEDYVPLIQLENSTWTREIRDYPKGTLEFRDYMTGRLITPCNITEVILRV